MCTTNNCYSVSRKGIFTGIETFCLRTKRGDKEVVTFGRGSKLGSYVMLNVHALPRVEDNRMTEACLSVSKTSGTFLFSANEEGNDRILVKVQFCKEWRFADEQKDREVILITSGSSIYHDEETHEGLFSLSHGAVIRVVYTDGYEYEVSVGERGQVTRECVVRPEQKDLSVKIFDATSISSARDKRQNGRKSPPRRQTNGCDSQYLASLEERYGVRPGEQTVASSDATSPQA